METLKTPLAEANGRQRETLERQAERLEAQAETIGRQGAELVRLNRQTRRVWIVLAVGPALVIAAMLAPAWVR